MTTIILMFCLKISRNYKSGKLILCNLAYGFMALTATTSMTLKKKKIV